MTFTDELSPLEIRDRVGNMRQLGRADLFESVDGPGRGARVARLTCADGFDIEVFPDRGLDLGAVTWRGIPLAWLSATGPIAPGLLSNGSSSWGRGFGGGLLTTCGLDQFGSESHDDGVVLPLHGRAHTLAASGVHVWSRQVHDEWQVGIAGHTRQSAPFGENLRLDRSITTAVGSSELRIRDTVTNDGHETWPHMVLYHFNLGWPLIDESSSLRVVHTVGDHEIDGTMPAPRDDDAAEGIADWAGFDAPHAGFAEQVFRHELPPEASTRVEIASPRAGIRVTISFPTSALPHLFQWKLLGTGTYVVGIEPANSSGIGGRASARERESLDMLAPGESRHYELSVAVSPVH